MTTDTIAITNVIIFEYKFGEEKLLKPVNALQKKDYSVLKMTLTKFLTFIRVLIVTNRVPLKAAFR